MPTWQLSVPPAVPEYCLCTPSVAPGQSMMRAGSSNRHGTRASHGNNPRDQIVADDLLAVTLLDVRWTPLAVRRLLCDHADEVSKLLLEVDDKTEIWAPDSRNQLDAAEPLWSCYTGFRECVTPGRANCWPANGRGSSQSQTASSSQPSGRRVIHGRQCGTAFKMIDSARQWSHCGRAKWRGSAC